jgi:hypothetical protein
VRVFFFVTLLDIPPSPQQTNTDMLEQLMNMVSEHSQEAVVKNPEVPNEQNNDVMQSLMGSIMGGLQSEAQKGNITDMIGLLSGKSVQQDKASLMNNPIVSGIASNAISNLVQKLGLSDSTASRIVSMVLPMVISQLIQKTSNRSDGSLDFNGILGSLMGTESPATEGPQGAGFDFNQLGYDMADGKLDMNDLIRVGGGLLRGGGNSSSENSSPDLGGLLGGLFGKK